MFPLCALAFLLLGVLSYSCPIAVNDTADFAIRTGRGTWFNPSLGACGKNNTDSDLIVAISAGIYRSGGNCDQWMTIINTQDNQVANGLVRDECMGCGEDDIDMSPALFSQLGSLDTGVLNVSWHFQPKGWSP